MALGMWPDEVQIVEVGPRDGLQSIKRVFSTDVKVRMIEDLIAAGCSRIEVTAFSRPDVVPQHADAEELVARLPALDGVRYRGLVPNERGARRAIDCGLDEISVLVTASETYNRLNQNMSISKSLEALERISDLAGRSGTHVVAAIGLAMYCPYEGDVPVERTIGILRRCVEVGVTEAYLATSAGADGPRAVYELCTEVSERFPDLLLGLHLHDTNGMGLANALAGSSAGVKVFESSVCGLGGGIRLPEARDDYGNVATEDLVNLFTECGISTGIDLQGVVACARKVSRELDVPIGGRAATGGTKHEITEAARISRYSKAHEPAGS